MTRKICFVLSLILCCNLVFAQKPAIYSTADGAVGGYDVVAYFKSGKPVKGFDSLSFDFKGAKWKFANQLNLDSFKNNPTAFVPKYGGYCAYGLSSNYKAPTSADAWTIVDGQLYLNYNKDVQTAWKKEMEARIIKADKNWPALENR